jgi:hypothetical protein
MLFQDPVQHPIKAHDPAANIGAVKLKGQDRIIPSDFLSKCHGFSFGSRLGISRL